MQLLQLRFSGGVLGGFVFQRLFFFFQVLLVSQQFLAFQCDVIIEVAFAVLKRVKSLESASSSPNCLRRLSNCLKAASTLSAVSSLRRSSSSAVSFSLKRSLRVLARHRLAFLRFVQGNTCRRLARLCSTARFCSNADCAKSVSAPGVFQFFLKQRSLDWRAGFLIQFFLNFFQAVVLNPHLP
jgi:hypothetical protein